MMKHSVVFACSLILFPLLSEAAWTLECAPTKPDGVYAPGEPVTFRARLLRDGAMPAASEGYRIGLYTRANGQFVTNAVGNAGAAVEATVSLPSCGWIFVHAAARGPNGEMLADGKRKVEVKCGALVDPEACRQGVAEPKDFDAYWAAEREKVLASPANTKIVKNENPIVAKEDGYYLFSADLPAPFKGPTAMCDFGGQLAGHDHGWPRPYFIRTSQTFQTLFY